MLIDIENKSLLSDIEFEKIIWKFVSICNSCYTCVENYNDKCFYVRSDGFTFDKLGINKLKVVCYELRRHLKDAEVNISIFIEDYYLKLKMEEYTSLLKSLEENIDFVD